MRYENTLKSICFVALLSHFTSSCTQCTAQYDAAPMKERLQQERVVASNPPQSLTENGDLPPTGKVQADPAERYATLCTSCHGPKGAGDGPGAVALNPKPRNLTDTAWQSQATDDRIYTVIKNGGTAVGLSATMAPWGSILSDDEIKSMVVYIRGMGKN